MLVAAAICIKFIHLEIFEVHFDCAGLQNLLGPSGTFRDRCRRSGWFYVDVQLSWQVQYFWTWWWS